MAANVIDAFLVTLGLDATQFDKGRAKIQIDLGITVNQANQAAKEIEAAGKRASQFYTRLRNEALALFAVFTAGRGIKDFISSITSGDAALYVMAKQLGMATDELAAWQEAVVRVGGHAEGATSSINGLQQAWGRFRAFGQVPQELIVGFARLNVALDRTIPTTEMLLRLADKFHALPIVDAQVIGTSMGLDPALINLLHQGRAVVEHQLGEIKARGVPGDEDGKRALQLMQDLQALRRDLEAVARTVINTFSPQIHKFLQDMDRWFQENHKWLTAEVQEEFKSFVAWVKVATFYLEAFGRGLVKMARLFGVRMPSEIEEERRRTAEMGGATPETPVPGDDRMNENAVVPVPPGAWLRTLLPRLLGGASAQHQTPEQRSKAHDAMDYLMGPGKRWSAEEAAAIVGNLMRENPNFDPTLAITDSDGKTHKGLAMWSPERAALIEKRFGRRLEDLNVNEQLDAAHWELTGGRYKFVGQRLKDTEGGFLKSAIVTQGFETPANQDREVPLRALNAQQLLREMRAAQAHEHDLSPSLRPGARLTAPQGGPQFAANQSSEVNVSGPITIHTQATDARGIANSLRDRLQAIQLASQFNTGLA